MDLFFTTENKFVQRDPHKSTATSELVDAHRFPMRDQVSPFSKVRAASAAPAFESQSPRSKFKNTWKRPNNMNSTLKYKLQPIRVPSGWTITINNLFEVELTKETAEWFSSSVLLGGVRRSTGHCFDARV